VSPEVNSQPSYCRRRLVELIVFESVQLRLCLRVRAYSKKPCGRAYANYVLCLLNTLIPNTCIRHDLLVCVICLINQDFYD
jgi:hypothetical protein